jgi:hypothetical protein
MKPPAPHMDGPIARETAAPNMFFKILVVEKIRRAARTLRPTPIHNPEMEVDLGIIVRTAILRLFQSAARPNDISIQIAALSPYETSNQSCLCTGERHQYKVRLVSQCHTVTIRSGIPNVGITGNLLISGSIMMLMMIDAEDDDNI